MFNNQKVRMMKPYHFAKVAMKHDNPTEGCWYFVAQTEKQLREHWEKYAGADIKAGVQQLAERLSGSFCSHWTSNFASLVAMKCELNDQPYFIQAVLMENELFQNRLQYLKEDGVVYLLPSLTVFGYSPKLHQIIEAVDSEKLIYPDEVIPTINDVKFLMWSGGKHWYAKIGKVDIVDKFGNQKWDTKEEAERAAIEYIQNNYG